MALLCAAAPALAQEPGAWDGCCLSERRTTAALEEVTRHFPALAASMVQEPLHAQNGFQDKSANSRLTINASDLEAVLTALGHDATPLAPTTPKRDLVGVDWWLTHELAGLQGGKCKGIAFRYCWVGAGLHPVQPGQMQLFILQYDFPLDFIDHIE